MWLQHPLLSHHPPGQSCWNSCGRPEQRRRNWGRPSESLKKISISIMEGRWDTRLFKEWSPATSHMFNDFSFVFLNSAEIVYSLNQDNLYVGCIHLWRTPFSVFHTALFWSLTASLLWKNKYHTFWQASLCVRALSVWIDQRKNSLSLCVAGNLAKLWKWKPGGVWEPYSEAKKVFLPSWYVRDVTSSHCRYSDPLTRKSRSFSEISF